MDDAQAVAPFTAAAGPTESKGVGISGFEITLRHSLVWTILGMLANEGQGLAATLHDFILDGYPREEAQSEVRRLKADKEYADNEIAKAECKLDATADKHLLVANLRRAAAKGLKSIFHGQL